MAKSSKSNKPVKSKTSPTKSTARVVSRRTEDAAEKQPVETVSARKPRIRKVETVRERNLKASSKAAAKANKPRGRVRRSAAKAGSTVYKPFKKPLRLLSSPFRTKPVRFLGRLIGRILWPKYFRDAYKEVRQVTWPSRKDTLKLTLAVLVFALIFGLAAAGTDYVLDKIIQRIIFRA